MDELLSYILVIVVVVLLILLFSRKKPGPRSTSNTYTIDLCCPGNNSGGADVEDCTPDLVPTLSDGCVDEFGINGTQNPAVEIEIDLNNYLTFDGDIDWSTFNIVSLDYFDGDDSGFQPSCDGTRDNYGDPVTAEDFWGEASGESSSDVAVLTHEGNGIVLVTLTVEGSVFYGSVRLIWSVNSVDGCTSNEGTFYVNYDYVQ